MIRASRSLAVSAILVSGALHVAGLSVFGSEERVEVAGGATVNVARLGNSFQDVAQGVRTADRPEGPHEAERPETADGQMKPKQRLEAAVTPERSATVRPERTRTGATPERPDRLAMKTAPDLAQQERKAIVRPTLSPAIVPEMTVQTMPEPLEATRPEPTGMETAATTDPQAIETEAPRVLAALPRDDATAPVLSSRPKTRPAGLAPERSQAERRKTAASRPGGNQPEQVRGSTDGEREAARSQRSDRRSAADAEAGTAAASNYPGQVQRQIFRQRRPGVNSRGTALVSFRIASSGALVSVGIAQSSGSQALDTAAVQLVRRAAPFPAPPAGARRSFTIGIEGR